MTTMMRLLKENGGLETVEYSILTALIVGSLVGTLLLLLSAMTGQFRLAIGAM